MNSQGRLVDRLDVELKVPGFHHDMFITENYMVLVDGSTRFTPEGVVKGQPLWNFDQARTASRDSRECNGDPDPSKRGLLIRARAGTCKEPREAKWRRPRQDRGSGS